MGNLGSIQNMLKAVDVQSVVTSDYRIISNAQKLILPGVGAFDSAMERINGSGLRDVLDRKVLEEKVPVLGICLGMQLLTRGSEEGVLPGLGWIQGDTTRFPKIEGLKVPHMGWNLVASSSTSKLTKDLGEEPRFYFVHSYAVSVDDQKHSILKTTYGIKFDSAIQKGNIYGAQFHPEKSHRFGKRLFKNFAEL
jgi:glutamine amidotransferase